MVVLFPAMRLATSALVLLCLSMAASACKEEGSIKVHKLKFNGVKAVDEARLKTALATKESSWIPWGRKHYFDRSRFDADLKRVQAFYADRGYPDARVSGFDVKLNDKQDEVDLIVTIAEGEPIKVAAINFTGFDVIPPAHFDRMTKGLPLKIGEPRDRQLVVTIHEMAVNELRDHGYPYAKVSTQEDDGADERQATLDFAAEPGKVAHFGPVEISGNKTVSDHVIENASCRSSPATCISAASCRNRSAGCTGWSYFSSRTSSRATRSSSRKKCRFASRWRKAITSA